MFDLHPTEIDMIRLCDSLGKKIGRPVSDVEAALWLRDKGFVPYNDGWLGDSESLPFLEEMLTQPTGTA